jgi:carbonic anhydrase/acetyltransferase-like protein (isoleucine patch superfamily)
MNIFGKAPAMSNDTFIAPNAAVIGNVSLGDRTSVWYGAVVRGDFNAVKIGAMTSVQDRAVIHTVKALPSGFPATTTIGNYVVVGHGATINSSTIMDEAHIGNGCVLEEGSLVESHTILEAGSVVPAGGRIPSGQVWGGNPAVYVRDLTEAEAGGFQKAAAEQAWLAGEHAGEFFDYGAQYLDAERIKAEGGSL